MKIEGKFLHSKNSDWHPSWYEGDFRQGQAKDERMYDELSRLGALLRLPVPQVHMEIEVKMPDGTVVEKHRMRSRTFVRNFWNYMADVLFFPPNSAVVGYVEGSLVIKNTAGTLFNAPGSAGPWDGITTGLSIANWFILAGSGSATLAVTSAGIVIGTGTVPESFNSFALANLIATGNGAGQMAYSAQGLSTQNYDFTTKTLSVSRSRIFNNNSGANITVTETGIYGTTNGGSFMFLRDLLSSPVTVLNAAQLTVTYVMSMVFPADVVNEPPYLGNSQMDPMIMQSNVSRNWNDPGFASPRTWRSTEQWQRQGWRNFKQ